jgi:hypothetical protein
MKTATVHAQFLFALSVVLQGETNVDLTMALEEGVVAQDGIQIQVRAASPQLQSSHQQTLLISVLRFAIVRSSKGRLASLTSGCARLPVPLF